MRFNVLKLREMACALIDSETDLLSECIDMKLGQ